MDWTGRPYALIDTNHWSERRSAKSFGATSWTISSYVRTNFQLKRFKRTYSLQVTNILREHILSHYFVKPFLLKTIITFCLLASFSARQEDHFQKIDVQNKTDFPFRFCKIGLRNTLLLKNGRLFLFVFLFVCCNNLSDFGLLF